MHNYCILIVDDEKTVRESIKTKLEKVAKESGHRICIIEASKPSKAIVEFANKRIDILFLDYNFQDGEKSESLISFLTKMDLFVYLIIVSGHPDNPLEQPGRCAFKYDDYIPKGTDDSAVTDGAIREAYNKATEHLNSRPLPNPIDCNKIIYDSTSDSDSRARGEIANLITFCETSLKFLIYILLSDIREQNQKSENIIIPEFELKEYYEFGYSRTLFTELFRQARQTNCSYVSEIIALIETKFSNKEYPLGFLQKVIDRRNPLYHSNSSYTDYELKEILSELSSSFNEFKDRFRLFLHYPLIYLENINNYQYEGRLLMGDEIKGRMSYFESKIFDDINIDNRYPLNQVYLKTPYGLLSLHPFIIFQTCNECRTEKVFLMNGTSRPEQKIKYKCMANHEYKDLDSTNYQKLESFIKTGIW
jgi:hypothetical protein